jgi:hypothetical protein
MINEFDQMYAPSISESRASILFDATHKEWGEMYHSELRQLLLENGFSVDVLYLSDHRLGHHIIKETDFKLNAGSRFSITFSLDQAVPVLVLNTLQPWNFAPPPRIKVVDPTGKELTTYFWPTPHNIHFHEPPVGLWTITLETEPDIREPQANSLVVGYFTADPINPELLRNYQILMLDLPFLDFSPQEIDGIVAFVQNGGRLFLGGGSRNLDALSSTFGIQFTDVNVEDSTHEVDGYPIIRAFASHPVVEGLNELVGGQVLALRDPAKALAFSDGDSTPPNAPVMALSEFGKGRVFAIGSQDTLRDGDYVRLADGRKLALNVFDWLRQNLAVATQSTTARQATTSATSTYATSTTPVQSGAQTTIVYNPNAVSATRSSLQPVLLGVILGLVISAPISVYRHRRIGSQAGRQRSLSAIAELVASSFLSLSSPPQVVEDVSLSNLVSIL